MDIKRNYYYTYVLQVLLLKRSYNNLLLLLSCVREYLMISYGSHINRVFDRKQGLRSPPMVIQRIL